MKEKKEYNKNIEQFKKVIIEMIEKMYEIDKGMQSTMFILTNKERFLAYQKNPSNIIEIPKSEEMVVMSIIAIFDGDSYEESKRRKELFRNDMVNMFKIIKPQAIIFASEAWMVQAKKDITNEEDFVKIRPSESPDRIEGVFLVLETMFYEKSFHYKIERDIEDKPTLIGPSEETFIPHDSLGLFSNFLQRTEDINEN